MAVSPGRPISRTQTGARRIAPERRRGANAPSLSSTRLQRSAPLRHHPAPMSVAQHIGFLHGRVREFRDSGEFLIAMGFEETRW